MTAATSTYEYLYRNSDRRHHHAYLLEPLLAMLEREKLLRQQQLRVLDLGCGNGSLSHSIAEAGYDVVGVEESNSGIELARSNFANCRFIQASIYNLPDAELAGKFDIVITSEVIEHLIYPRELLRAAKKCLTPKGRLIITTPYHGYWKNLAIAAAGKMDSHFTPLWDGGHIKFFSPKTLRSLLESEAYGQIEFKFAGRFPYFWKSMLCASSPAGE